MQVSTGRAEQSRCQRIEIQKHVLLLSPAVERRDAAGGEHVDDHAQAPHVGLVARVAALHHLVSTR